MKTKLCGMNVLIPSRSVCQVCSSVQRLPMLWAATWDAMCRDVPLEDTINFHMMLTHKSREEVLANYERFCEELYRKGFMIKVPEEPAEVEQ